MQQEHIYTGVGLLLFAVLVVSLFWSKLRPPKQKEFTFEKFENELDSVIEEEVKGKTISERIILPDENELMNHALNLVWNLENMLGVEFEDDLIACELIIEFYKRIPKSIMNGKS